MNGRPAATVTHDLELQLVVPGDATVPLAVRLSYAAQDPYAVTAEFRTGVEETVRWVFARDLLTTGLHCPAGEGDVRVWPSFNAGVDVVYVALASPDGQALLEAPAGAIEAFLDKTYALVPVGMEGSFVDVDASLARLLHHH